MKKQLMYLLLIGTTLFSQAICAQESNLLDSSWGLKFGASKHWQDNDNADFFNFDTDLGFLAGMYFKKPFGKFIATSYEWQVMGMGYRIDATDVQELEKIIVNRSYIQVLLNLHLTPTEFIDISLGGYAGIAVDSNEEWHYASGVDERDKENNLRQLDAGTKLNVSLQISRIGLGLEYYHGLIDTHIEPEFTFTNRAISLSVRYFME